LCLLEEDKEVEMTDMTARGALARRRAPDTLAAPGQRLRGSRRISPISAPICCRGEHVAPGQPEQTIQRSLDEDVRCSTPVAT